MVKSNGFVPRTGLEPAHPNGHHPLKVACLPISTPGHSCNPEGTAAKVTIEPSWTKL